MAQQKPTIPKGMRDFNAGEIARRNYIFDTIRNVFTIYRYAPIETPTMENLTTLMGKYGTEGDKLLFKVLNSGDYGANLSESELQTARKICEKGLRYDLTVPFARYVVQHRNDIVFPFKRYQIAPVWRADRPQKGRYREFVQCDVDVVGTNSLLCEVELIQIVGDVFAKLGINVALKINNRKILASIAAYIGHPDSLIDIAIGIDKLDKIGIEGVEAELFRSGISADGIDKLKPILNIEGSNVDKIKTIRGIIGDNDGIDEILQIFDYIQKLDIELNVELDLSLARGLNYYTGAIFEVKALDTPMGSISGGGRYDNLTGIFGLDGVSGVGISFGADRIYDVMDALNLFPSSIVGNSALFVNFGGADELCALQTLATARAQGLSAELYPVADKLKKQFDYATAKGVQYMIFIGESERESGIATIKCLSSGEQRSADVDKVAYVINNW